jgi:hypothetical protein
MISKELLSEVLGIKYDFVQNSYEGINFLNYGNYSEKGEHINIHELAHKCKEWANEKEYALYSGKNDDIWIIATEEYFLGRPQGKLEARPEFTSDTEPEAIFKACQWMLDNDS